jgi:hypothetical protein
MSNYTKVTNFTAKDSLPSGNSGKVVRGSEIDTEFTNIQTAVNSKADTASPTFTGTVVIPTATISGGTITGITDLAIADGGTGASTAQNARNNLLPTQTSNSGKYLKTDGTNVSWDDLDISTADITGTLPVANGGTNATTASAARTNLGLAIGTDVQAYDAELAALAGLTSAADKLPYFTGAGTAATADFTSFGRSIVDDANAGAARTTLGLVIGTDVQAYDAQLADIAGLTPTDNNFIVGNGTNFVTESGSTARTSLGLGSIATQDSSNVSITGGSVTGITDLAVADGGTGASNASGARTNLGLVIGTDVQGYDAQLADIAGLTPTDNNFIVGNGTNFVTESGSTARTSLGLGSIATQDASNVAITGGSVSGITDLAVADGGTGASDAATARTNLGLAIGTDVQGYDAQLADIAGLTPTDNNFIVGNGTNFVTESGSTARTSLGLGSIATQDASNVSITGGSVSGITDLAVADGGTGASTAANARINLLPSYTGNGSKVLALNSGATDVEWTAVTTSAAGSNTQLQYNNSGSFAGASGLVTDGTNLTLNGQADLRFADSDSSNWVAFQAPATISSNVTWTLPSADGSSGQVLSTNGSGTLSWATASGGGGGGGTSVTRTEFTATSGQTSFTVSYTAGQIDVYLNGALLAAADYTATNGTSVVLTTGATLNDILTVVAYNSATQITQGDSKVEVTDTGNGVITFTTDNSERMRVTSGGQVLVGATTARSDFFNTTTVIPRLQVECAASDNLNRFASITSNNSDTGGANLLLAKTRGTTIGSVTIVQNDDQIGGVSFQGADGVNLVEAARIIASVDGTPGSDDMPGRLVFLTTADGAASPTERMRISADGTIKTSSTISVGGATPSTSGAGITFPATASASTNANTLDDYEEGTWTPTYVTESGANFTSVTYQGFTDGSYTKIGDLCYIRGQIATTGITVGSASGNIAVGGLPFNGATGGTFISCISISGLWAGEIPSTASVGASAKMVLYYKTAADGVVLNSVVADLSTSSNNNYLQFAGVFKVA